MSIHSDALVGTKSVGANTTIAAFAHVATSARIGAHCAIGHHVFIDAGVVVGDRVAIEGGGHLGAGVVIEDGARIGPNVTFASDAASPITVRAGARIGGGSSLVAGITVGQHAQIAVGTVVTQDVPPNALVSGNPAHITGYALSGSTPTAVVATSSGVQKPGVTKSRVRGVALITSLLRRDLRGDLIALELEKDLPFVPRRSFVVLNVPSEKIRGEHAHRVCHQLLYCLNGTIHCLADDGVEREAFSLSSPNVGLYLPPMTWATQYKYSSDAVLQVYASHSYEAGDYIRDYETFLREALG